MKKIFLILVLILAGFGLFASIEGTYNVSYGVDDDAPDNIIINKNSVEFNGEYYTYRYNYESNIILCDNGPIIIIEDDGIKVYDYTGSYKIGKTQYIPKSENKLGVKNYSSYVNGNIVGVYQFSKKSIKQLAIQSISGDENEYSKEEMEGMINLYISMIPKDKLPIVVVYDNAIAFDDNVTKSYISENKIHIFDEVTGKYDSTAEFKNNKQILNVVLEGKSEIELERVDNYKLL